MPTEPASHAFIYLASQSPRRAQLLEQIGVAHRPLLPDADEDAESLEAVQPGERPEAYVQRVVADKLGAAVARLQRRGDAHAPILCADTTVALGSRILGKPQGADEARRMLQALSGRTHRVITGVGLAWGRGHRRREQVLQVSRVRFSAWTPAQIEAYIASRQPFGKAGAYGIQGIAAAFIAHIEGSHSSIMGLPLHETAGLLAKAGMPVGLQP